MIRSLRSFFAFSAAEQRVFLAALLLGPVFASGLRVVGLAKLSWLAGRGKFDALPRRHAVGAERVAGLVAAACKRMPFGVSCLTRSLLLQWLLGRQGIRSDLRIGVRIVAGRLEAHAWIECAGHPINDMSDVGTRFAPFDGPVPTRAFFS